jgi:surfeit locus 1 family protein
MIALTLSLMRWQLNRAHEKATLANILAARVEAPVITLNGPIADGAALRYFRVQATGTWRPADAIYVDNRTHGQQTGFHVLVPLQIAPTQEVVVNIGFVARSREYPRAPQVQLPSGAAVVNGLAVIPSQRYVELAASTIVGAVWQNFDLVRYQQVTQRQALPVVVLATPTPTGLTAVDEKPSTGIDKHRGYAFQWGALAFAIFIVWIVTNVQLNRRPPPGNAPAG